MRSIVPCARQANGNGPDERETNLKLVYEQAPKTLETVEVAIPEKQTHAIQKETKSTIVRINN